MKVQIYLLVCICVANAHETVPTYFHRRHSDGSLVDRADEDDFYSYIRKPYKSTLLGIYQNSMLSVTPNKVSNRENVTITWNIAIKPSNRDWIGLFCPVDNDIVNVLDYFEVTVSEMWKTGKGSYNVVIYNLRQDCVFRYYHFDRSLLLAVSDVVTFINGFEEPVQGHISMTGNPNEMRVTWVSGTDSVPMVYYGLFEHALILKYHGTTKTYNASQMCAFPASSIGFRNPGFVHDVLLRILLPNTRYFYQFGSGNSFSAVYNFTTPIPAGDSTPHIVITYGDHGVVDCPGAAGTSKRIVQEYRENGIRKVLHNGDISYAMGYAYIWDQWFSLVQPYATLVPYMVTIGNHEQDHLSGGSKDPSGAKGNGYHPIWGNYGADSGGECGVPMYYRFHMPDNGNSLWWYSYDFGLVHYTVISTEHDYSPGSRQYQWLKNDLENIDRKLTPWIVVAGHRPMYTSQEQLDEYEVAINMQRFFEDLLFTFKVDLALWSHVHSYQRTCKVYRNKCTKNGIVHIVTGTAGRPIDLEFFMDKPWLKFSSKEYGYGRLHIVNNTAMRYEFVTNKNMQVLDSYWFIK